MHIIKGFAATSGNLPKVFSSIRLSHTAFIDNTYRMGVDDSTIDICRRFFITS